MRALLSVATREGIGPFARDLLSVGVEVFATDGTREFLANEGVEVRSVFELTGAEPIAGGQVKTLHPSIYAGLLARRDKPEQLDELAAQGIGLIDLVAVNVSHFAPQVGSRLVPIDEAIEMSERMAPEHVVCDSSSVAARLTRAGTVFIGLGVVAGSASAGHAAATTSN